MYKEIKKKIISQKNGNTYIFPISNSNLKVSESIKTNVKESLNKKIINIIPNDKKMVLDEVVKKEENINRNDLIYKTVIKRIANKLKKRVKFPRCKIFKFYISYRLLIQRIANRIKIKSKKVNFLEKLGNNNIKQDINQIQEIDTKGIKIISEKGKQKINKKIISFCDKNKNIQINLSLFTKNEKNKKSNLVINNNNKSEINNLITYLKDLNIDENNPSKFIDEFSSFLDKNNIQICPDTKLPLFINNNNKYLLNQEEFWIKYILFISNKYKQNLTINTFIYLIEQFYIWNDKNINDDFINEIKDQINNLFSKEIINNFLILYKIKNLDGLFERYKYIYKNINIYKEIKIGDNECNCPTCKKEGLIKKVINYNNKNNKISLAKNNNLSIITNPKDKNDLNKRNNSVNNKSLNSIKDYENEQILKYLRKGNKKPKDYDA